MRNSRFRGRKRWLLEFLELTVLRGVYMWVVKSEDGKELEKVGFVVVRHPLMVDDIEAGLDFGDWRGVVRIIADAFSFKWGFPSYRAEDGKVRDIWKRSRLIRIFDYYPERSAWRISSYVEQLGVDKKKISMGSEVVSEGFRMFLKQLGEDNLPIFVI
jgi:hypothetical protein